MRKIRSSKKGFTLAELLIVVAIIGVLVGISIPIFTTQLAKSRLATNKANARAAKAAAIAAYLDSDEVRGGTYDVGTGKLTTVKSAPTVSETNIDISSWSTDDYGDKTYDTVTVALNDKGEITGFTLSNKPATNP